jgi:hypothetical protein
MHREYFEITLPYQSPQIVEVRLWGGGASRLALVDRFGRSFWLNGESVGFNVRVFRSTTLPPKIRLVIYGDYEKALFTSFDCVVKEVPIRRIKNED